MSDVSPIRLVGRPRPASDDPSPVPLARRPDFDLGGTRVFPSRLLLDGPARSVPIERRVMEVLLTFVDAEGAVLSREELLRRCWPGVVVGDDAVHRAIGALRKAAAATGNTFVIETIPRIGYRLNSGVLADAGSDIAATDEPVDAQPAAVAVVPASAAPEPRRLSRRWLLAGGAAALSAGALTWWKFGASPPVDPEAARLVAQARLALRPGTAAKDREAIATLERAAAIAPEHAEAWGLLALARARGEQHAPPDAAALATASIDEAAQRALAIDPGNADASAALALAIPYYGDWLAAERRFDAVLEKNPDHAIAQDSRMFLLGAVGRMRESGLARVAFAPGAPFDANMQYGLIYGLWFLDRIEEADRVASRALEMWPRHTGVWLARLWLLAGTGRYDRALVQIDDAVSRPATLPEAVVATLRTAIAAAHTRQPAAVGAAVDRVMAGVSQSVAAVVNGMMLLNHLGATDRAFDLARAYYLEQGPVIASVSWRPGQPAIRDQRRRKTNMLFTPTAAAMRSDPRFVPLVEQMGLADYWDRRGVRPDFLA